ncbi:hypothetical protein BASA60_001986 [Batrachochytrium salamandrivorans]|nr:hypothetical protein BASA60_001986 [Batrachochytrium salamandrivorans]
MRNRNFGEQREHLSAIVDDMQLRVQNGIGSTTTCATPLQHRSPLTSFPSYRLRHLTEKCAESLMRRVRSILVLRVRVWGAVRSIVTTVCPSYLRVVRHAAEGRRAYMCF